MKKILLMMGTAFSALALSVSCTKDGNGGGTDTPPVHPMVGTYALASYEVAEIPAEEEGGKPTANYPVSSPLYAVWEAGDAFTFNMQGTFRLMGGYLIPQMLNTIELKADGFVGASHVAAPQLKTDKLMTWGMGAFLGGTFPSVDEVTADAATDFVTSKGNFVSWSEANGIVTLKVDIDAVLADAGVEGIGEIIGQVLSQKPEDIKNMLKAFLETAKNENNADTITQLVAEIDLIDNKTIEQLLGWAKNGIPMTKEEKDGKVNIFLPKTAFDSLMTLKKVGEKEEGWNPGVMEPIMKNDLMIVWDSLDAIGFLPKEAEMAGFMINLMGAYWEKTTDFALGLSLVKVVNE